RQRAGRPRPGAAWTATSLDACRGRLVSAAHARTYFRPTMSTRYQPALNLVDRFLQDLRVSRIWSREIGAWGAAPGSADAKSIASRLGWLDTGNTMRPHLER